MFVNYQKKFKLFVDRGLIDSVPTRWQLFQGWLEMAAYILYPAINDDGRHDGPLGHPIVRQPFLVLYTKGGQLLAGVGILASRNALIAHLLGTHHAEQPAYDMQLLQLHEGGLDALRQRIIELRDPQTFWRKREKWLLNAIQGAEVARAYQDRMLVEIDNIENAHFQEEWPGKLRKEHNVFSHFVNYCLRRFPRTVRSESFFAMLKRVGKLPFERLRRYKAAA